MLNLILIEVEYLQNFVFNFEKDSISQNHSSGSHHAIKKSPFSKISHLPLRENSPQPLTLFRKSWDMLC